jgi:hypothetical protein
LQELPADHEGRLKLTPPFWLPEISMQLKATVASISHLSINREQYVILSFMRNTYENKSNYVGCLMIELLRAAHMQRETDRSNWSLDKMFVAQNWNVNEPDTCNW